MTVKICPECQAENPASEDICTQCAYPLDAVDAGHEPDEGPTCSNCGKVVKPDMKFCDGCGANLLEPPPATPPLPVTEPDASSDEDGPSGVDSAGAPAPTPVQPAQRVPPPPVTPADDSPPPAAAASDQGWKLSVVEGFSIGKEYLLFKQEMLLGRLDPDSDIYPDIDLEDQDDGYVSRRHAIVRNKDGLISIEDCGGENGTTIDRKRIPAQKPLPLDEGQVVRIGKVGLMLKSHKKG